MKIENDVIIIDHSEWKSASCHRENDNEYSSVFPEYTENVKGYMIYPATIFLNKDGIKTPVLAKTRIMKTEDEILKYEDLSNIYLYKVLKNNNENSEFPYKIRYGKLE